MSNKKIPPRPTAGKPLTVRFGGLVRLHRDRLEITQMELAERAGVSKDLIAKIESGATGARFQNIQSIADALGVDPAELFSAELPRGSLMSPQLAQLFGRLAKLSDSDFAWIKGVIDAALRPR
jgi:transcriptional regulator with XRE-family HTH domain